MKEALPEEKPAIGHTVSKRNRTVLRIRQYIKMLGPGLITGASDDDPSGIATYSQAGAQFGLATLWTAWITFPLMAAVQEMCARIGIVTRHGLAGNLKKHYSRPFLYVMILLSFPAITLNIGADIEGVGAVTNLLIPGIPAYIFSIAFTGILLFSVIKFNYKRIELIMKWLCLVLLLYFIVPFLVHQDWLHVLKSAIVPTIRFNKDFISILVAILGTTISPYLFFWQASMEVEELKEKGASEIFVDKRALRNSKSDTNFGMFFSNIVMLFIILTAGSVLFPAGITNINTVEEAAKALQPLAGNMAYLLFALGVIGTGALAIPVLAGASSYIIAETFNWKQGLNKKYYQAKGFYLVFSVSLILGLLLNFIGISPIQALIYTAILYGITAPIFIGMILHICNNKKIMGEYTNSRRSNIFSWAALILMALAAIALLYLELT